VKRKKRSEIEFLLEKRKEGSEELFRSLQEFDLNLLGAKLFVVENKNKKRKKKGKQILKVVRTCDRGVAWKT
jgi:hypothetical protein